LPIDPSEDNLIVVIPSPICPDNFEKIKNVFKKKLVESGNLGSRSLKMRMIFFLDWPFQLVSNLKRWVLLPPKFHLIILAFLYKKN